MKYLSQSFQARSIRASLYEEQGGICALCGKPMPRKRKRRSDNWDAPTIDHIIPQSLGGSDHRDNLRLVHKRCNVERSNDIRKV